MRVTLILFMLCACSSPIPKLEDLMRSSYAIGCGEKAIIDIKGNPAEMADAVHACHIKSQAFDLRQVGPYTDDLEVYHKSPKVFGRMDK